MSSRAERVSLNDEWVDLGDVDDVLRHTGQLPDPVETDTASSFAELSAPSLSRHPSFASLVSLAPSEATPTSTPKLWRKRYGGAMCVGASAWSQKKWTDARYLHLPPVKTSSECWCEFYTGSKCVHCKAGYSYAEAKSMKSPKFPRASMCKRADDVDASIDLSNA